MTLTTNNFEVGDVISVQGALYKVRGTITYISRLKEYRLASESSNMEIWLEKDGDKYVKYRFVSSSKIDYSKYDMVEHTQERVLAAHGDVDVSSGDVAESYLYLCKDNDTYLSREVWDDETEFSEGTEVDPSQIKLVKKGGFFDKIGSKMVWLSVFFGIVLGIAFCDGGSSSSSVSVESYLNKAFTPETYITGNNSQKAAVFRCPNMSSVDAVARNIIQGTDGAFTSYECLANYSAVIMSNSKEICLVYSDIDYLNVVRIHYSTRRYAYENLDAPLHKASEYTETFYRSYYVEKCLSADSTLYANGRSHDLYRIRYYGFNYLNLGSSDQYRSYSQSVRQSSAARRSSGGGGHGGGGK